MSSRVDFEVKVRCAVSPEQQLVSSVLAELEYINNEQRVAEQLRNIRGQRSWDEIETHAAASALHSIYTGIERCLLLALKLHGHATPSGSHWHQQVLERAIECGAVDEGVRNRLQEYLAFRHMYRNAYGFMLDSELVAPLIDQIGALVSDFETSVKSALSGFGS